MSRLDLIGYTLATALALCFVAQVYVTVSIKSMPYRCIDGYQYQPQVSNARLLLDGQGKPQTCTTGA